MADMGSIKLEDEYPADAMRQIAERFLMVGRLCWNDWQAMDPETRQVFEEAEDAVIARRARTLVEAALSTVSQITDEADLQSVALGQKLSQIMDKQAQRREARADLAK